MCCTCDDSLINYRNVSALLMKHKCVNVLPQAANIYIYIYLLLKFIGFFCFSFSVIVFCTFVCMIVSVFGVKS